MNNAKIFPLNKFYNFDGHIKKNFFINDEFDKNDSFLNFEKEKKS